MSPIVFSIFDPSELAMRLHQELGYEIGSIQFHTFPDKEISVKLNTKVEGRPVIFIATLDVPNNKLLPLLFAAETARALGAKHITLLAPYLAYMRQDKQFSEGEGVTSQYFAALISRYFDKLMTIDPHLHRWKSLDQIYAIPTVVHHATLLMAEWISAHVSAPLIIGPDSESEQWVKAVAEQIHADFVIAEKTRKDDFTVEITIPKLTYFQDKTPVLMDDIISTAGTMLKILNQLKGLKKQPVCMGIHAVFAEDAYQKLLAENPAIVVTGNTIKHPSNGIDLNPLFIKTLREQFS